MKRVFGTLTVVNVTVVKQSCQAQRPDLPPRCVNLGPACAALTINAGNPPSSRVVDLPIGGARAWMPLSRTAHGRMAPDAGRQHWITESGEIDATTGISAPTYPFHQLDNLTTRRTPRTARKIPQGHLARTPVGNDSQLTLGEYATNMTSWSIFLDISPHYSHC